VKVGDTVVPKVRTPEVAAKAGDLHWERLV
jgi:hypothetical protein